MCQQFREVTHTRDTYTGTEDVATSYACASMQTLTSHAHAVNTDQNGWLTLAQDVRDDTDIAIAIHSVGTRVIQDV